MCWTRKGTHLSQTGMRVRGHVLIPVCVNRKASGYASMARVSNSPSSPKSEYLCTSRLRNRSANLFVDISLLAGDRFSSSGHLEGVGIQRKDLSALVELSGWLRGRESM
jgi:hypothetical protein